MHKSIALFPGLSLNCIANAFFAILKNRGIATSLCDKTNFYWFSSGGRYALFCFLENLSNITSKREVLLPSFTCCVVYAAVKTAGFLPIVYKASPAEPSGSLIDIESKISPYTACIITQSIFGFSSLEVACQIKQNHPDIFIVDDRAHGYQAIFEQPSDPYTAYFYSFEQSKIITCYKGSLLVSSIKINDLSTPPSPLLDAIDIFVLLTLFFSVTVFPFDRTFIIYRILVKIFLVKPSMSDSELSLISIEPRSRSMSFIKKCFLLPQLLSLVDLYNRQQEFLLSNGYIKYRLPNLLTRFIVTHPLNHNFLIASRPWFSTPFYPSTAFRDVIYSFSDDQYCFPSINNLVLSRRFFGL